MPRVITEGAKMVCSSGSQLTKLKVTSQKFSTIEGKLQATQYDLVAEENIPSFGTCKITRSKCICHAVKWQNTSAFSAIKGMEELTMDSTCKCSLGGTINFVQESNNASINNIQSAQNDSGSTDQENNNEDDSIKEGRLFSNSTIAIIVIFFVILLAVLAYLAIQQTAQYKGLR